MIMRNRVLSGSAYELGADRGSERTINYASNSAGFFAKALDRAIRCVARNGVLAKVEEYYAQKASFQIGSRFE